MNYTIIDRPVSLATSNSLKLITIEVRRTSDLDYPHPRLVFGDKVVLSTQLDELLLENTPLEDNLDIYTIRAMELIEENVKTPYWLYGLRSEFGTRELMWFAENELTSYQDALLDEEF